MLKVSGAVLCALLVSTAVSSAVETKVWDQSDAQDFNRGTVKNLSIRNDGRLALATSAKELDSTPVPYLWALAQDRSGTVYYAGGAPTGATARVFRLRPGGKREVAAEIPGLEIHALAVDREDRVYAAVLPDAKVYRLTKDGKAELFFDPKCKYIWAMEFDRAGNLYVGTGDTGILYRVAPDGKATKFFDSEEAHVRSLLMEDSGDIVIGTEPSGLIIRVDSAGKAFVLYETSRREVTAVAKHGGVIFAASVGSKTAPPIVTGPAPVLPTGGTAPVTPAGTPRTGSAPPSLAPPVGSISAQIPGGSEIDRITKDGFAERIWQSSTDLAYAITFDADGKPLVGTGNKGVIYRLDSDQVWTQLLTTPPTQVTGFLPSGSGSAYVVTGNVGNLYSLGPGSETSGTLVSDVLDSREFTYWGKAHVTSEANGGSVTLETRSGNLNNPENNWSAWTPVALTPQGGSVKSPPARFLQYRLTLKSGASQSPEVSAVDIAYISKNVAPRVRAVEVAPLNYRQAPSGNSLERNVNAAGSPVSLTLPAVGQRRTNLPSQSTLEGAGAATLQYSKGFLTIRWNASDANDDSLLYKVELRCKSCGAWQTLKDKLVDRYYAFDTTAFSDGEYTARVTATDAPGNIPTEALTGSLVSDLFRIDNAAPEITDLKRSGTTVTFSAHDALSWISKAEYSIDGGDWTLLTPLDRVTDSQQLSYTFQTQAGKFVSVRVFDENDNVVVKQLAGQ